MTVEVGFVAGMARSGSTLVAGAMSEELDWPDAGEIVLVWQRGLLDDRPCACGEDFSECAFWRDVVATAPDILTRGVAASVASATTRVTGAFGSLRLMSGPGLRRLDRLVPPIWYSASAALYRGIAEVSGTAGLVDSSKLPVLAYLLGRTPGLSLRTTHLVRDPRAVAWSWAHPHRGIPGVPDFPSLSPARAAAVWLMINLAAERLPDLGQATQVVRYEDAVRVMTAPEPPAHSMAGNPLVRLADTPLQVKEDERWRSGLSASDQAIVSLVTAPRLRRYGYAVQPR